MLRDGLYELFYRAGSGRPGHDEDCLLLALREGRLLGSDRWGGVFLGRCTFDAATGRHKIKVTLQVPPGGELVVDRAPRPEGGVFDIDTDFQDSEHGSGVVQLAGQPVRIELQFKGPMPV